MVISALALTGVAQAQSLRVAVAANFKQALTEVAQDYQQQTGVKVQISAGSTGALYTQILHGAPYDLFFAADIERPKLLEQNQQAKSGSRITYATGVLAFWSPGQVAAEQLLSQWDRRLAIANPRTAPYGVAAQQTLAKLRPQNPPSLVRGSNVLQAYQYVQSGNAQAGLVALSHLKAAKVNGAEYWLVPPSWYQPIEQQAVVLNRTHSMADACAFLRFVVQAEQPLQANGYLTQTVDGDALLQRCRS
ncbi:molybdate ABC transporter substrate-binding protein [uncultured Ferrimonas sp.]|uniref:molybdate ABC transporter substrate-binding protein n=1 Tax=uncultured Ferrimonas sp. TaxID=432640 RepID=UPI00262991FC|nr:molybdate ABC transporter substrate-binding protein [uncultured Ferrimonas sp.]